MCFSLLITVSYSLCVLAETGKRKNKIFRCNHRLESFLIKPICYSTMEVRKVTLFFQQKLQNFKIFSFNKLRMCVVLYSCLIGSNNKRKRGRETNNHQLSHLQTHQFPQVIDLSLLHNHQFHPPSNMVYTGLRLSSGEDQAQKISHHLNFVSGSPEDMFAAHMNRQSEELKAFLRAQVLISSEMNWVCEKF